MTEQEINKNKRNNFFSIAILLLIITILLFGCNDSHNDCLTHREDIIEEYDRWIELAREQNDSVQVLLFIEERNKRLDELDC